MISAVLALDISATYRAILLQVAVEMEEVVFFSFEGLIQAWSNCREKAALITDYFHWCLYADQCKPSVL